MAEKKKKLLTPVGFAKWAHVHTPKEPFKDKNGKTQGEPKFMIDICFSPEDPAWKVWASELKSAVNALPVQIDKRSGETIPKQMPIKREFDSSEKPTGRFYVTFKTGSQFKPGIFDNYGNPISETISIGNESKVRVAYMLSEYEAFGGGIALYLNAVQVIELVEYKSQSAMSYGFSVEQAPPATARLNQNLEDDLPF